MYQVASLTISPVFLRLYCRIVNDSNCKDFSCCDSTVGQKTLSGRLTAYLVKCGSAVETCEMIMKSMPFLDLLYVESGPDLALLTEINFPPFYTPVNIDEST